MKKQSFQDVLTQRNDLLHRQAVWQEVVAHLKKFLDTDTTPAQLGITTAGDGLVVPQPKIEAVITEIEAGPTTKILEELREIDNSEVAENVRKEDQAGKKASWSSRKGKGKSRPSA